MSSGKQRMDSFNIALALGIMSLVLILIFIYMTLDYSYWEKRNIPYIKPVFPFGNIKDLVTNKLHIGTCYKLFYHKMAGEKYFGVFELGQPTLVLRDLELIKSVMITDFQHFSDRGHIHENVKKNYLDRLHLFNLKNQEWKEMRHNLLPTFTSGRMKMMYQLMQNCSKTLDKTLVKKCVNDKIVDFSDLLARFTTDVTTSCMFGHETNAISDTNSEVRKISKLIFQKNVWNSIKLTLSVHHPYIFDLFGLEITHNKVKNFCMQVAKETYNYRVNNGCYGEDFIGLMIKTKQKNSFYDNEKYNDNEILKPSEKDDGLSFHQMAAQVFVMFAGAVETSSVTSTLALYEMCRNPEVMDEAIREIDEVLANHGGQITYQALNEMSYLEMIIYETLRLYPTHPVLTRKCVKSYRMKDSDFVIDKGLRVIIPVLALNLDPALFSEPERFNPERFRSKQPISLQFGDGPMKCIGLRFGKMQSKCALATILSKFKVFSAPQTPKMIKLNPSQFLTTPIEPIFLEISRRDDI